MASFGSMTLSDAQATPVTHTLNAMDHTGDNWIWRESAAASVLAAIVVTLSKIKVKANSGLEKYRIRVYIPALETATGANSSGYTAAPRLAYSLNLIMDYVIPSRASLQQRTDLMKYGRQFGETTQPFADVVLYGLMPS